VNLQKSFADEISIPAMLTFLALEILVFSLLLILTVLFHFSLFQIIKEGVPFFNNIINVAHCFRIIAIINTESTTIVSIFLILFKIDLYC
jgi:hypothetical protein